MPEGKNQRTNHRPQAAAPPRRVIIVGAGFAGVHTARRLTRLAGHRVEVTLIHPADYFLYLPLLPEVTAGILDPRRIEVTDPKGGCRTAGIRTGTTITEATDEGVRLSSGEFVPTRSLIWCVGVRPGQITGMTAQHAVRPGKLAARGYRLLSLPANRVRVAGDWALDAVLRRQSVQFGLVRGGAVPLSAAAASASRDLAAVSGGAA